MASRRAATRQDKAVAKRRITVEDMARRNMSLAARITQLESIVRRVPNYAVMAERYRRGEKSWCNTINELERDIEAAIPGCFENRLTYP